MSTATIHFNSQAERKTFAAGLQIVREKLAGHHKLTAAELAADSIARGRAIIAKRLGAAAHKKYFGTLPASPPVKPAAPARRNYAQPEQPQRTFHRFKTGRGLFA